MHIYKEIITIIGLFVFFLKMVQFRPLFRPFLSAITIITILFEKSVDGLLGIRTRGPQDGRSRRNHGAIAATHLFVFLQEVKYELDIVVF